MLIFAQIGSLLSIFIICMRCQSRCSRGRFCQFIRTTIHLLLSGSFLAYYFYRLATDSKSEFSRMVSYYDVVHIFRLIMFCSCVHLLFGLLVFSGLNTGRLFAPIIFAFAYILRKLVNRCCCREDWRNALTKILDEMVRVEGENPRAETREIEMEEIQTLEP